MYILLPPQIENGLENVLEKLSFDSLINALGDGVSREVNLTIPKFSLEKTVELVPILQRMGVGNLFNPQADLSGFTGSPLHLDDAIHKAKIIVDEEGSTAAAVTTLFSFRSARPVYDKVQFTCNHPFFYFIYDNTAKTILFSGLYRDPDN